MVEFSKQVNPDGGPRKRGNTSVLAEAASGDTTFAPAREQRARGGRLDKSPKFVTTERVPGDSPRIRLDRKRRKDGGWIDDATKNKGGLHRSLGIPEGEKIPEKKIKKAEKSDNPKAAKQARLAETLKGLRK